MAIFQKFCGVLAAFGAVGSIGVSQAEESAPPLTIVIHGGAGALEPGRYTSEQEAEFHRALNEALDTGYAILEDGGSATDAIVAAIVIMEDAPIFNAGKGAVFTQDGKNELDASIMEGETTNAGAIAGVTRVKNPIRLAREVMDNSRHVMFARDGAEEFAKERGLEFVKPKYFHTEHRWESYRKALEAWKNKKESTLPVDFKYGTVGALALDGQGNIAAGTSTGGMTFKQYGRVGDSPIIGAGTFADNRSCAVSATGHGEFFMRLTIVRDICAQVEYGGKSVADAADDVIHNRLTELGGDGGVIVLSPTGDYAFSFNSAGMFRGVKNELGEKVTAIYSVADEEASQ